jgi:hypothetical protein
MQSDNNAGGPWAVKVEQVVSAFECFLCDRRVVAAQMVTFGNPTPDSKLDSCHICWALIQRGTNGDECARGLVNSMLTPAKRQALGIHE